MSRYLLLTLIFTFTISSAGAEQLQLEIIPLQHRTTDEVIDIIRPLVSPGGSVAGMNNQLIIRTTAANLQEIRQVLESIDRAARRLRISVRQDVRTSGTSREQSVSGEYATGDIGISGRSESGPGTVISRRDSAGNIIRYRDLESHSATNDDHTFSVQALEGQPAYIQSGQSVPVSGRQSFIAGGSVIVQDTVEYRDIGSGFYVLPRLSGNNVTLLVAPQLSRISQGGTQTFDIQNVETTVHGRLGEWLDVGNISSREQGETRSNFDTRRFQQTGQRSIQIKVDEVE